MVKVGRSRPCRNVKGGGAVGGIHRHVAAGASREAGFGLDIKYKACHKMLKVPGVNNNKRSL